jgi:antitoxin FitA
MAQVIVRNLESSVKSRLKKRAQKNGRSMEEELRDILRNAANEERDPSSRGLGTEIASLFQKIGLDSDIPELRGSIVKPVSFEK